MISISGPPLWSRDTEKLPLFSTAKFQRRALAVSTRANWTPPALFSSFSRVRFSEAALVSLTNIEAVPSLRCTWRLAAGVVTPIPMPAVPDVRLLVGAPGRIRNGSLLPLVTSRTKKLVSLPATSQVCG